MDDPGDDDRAARIRHARQVLAGNELTPPNDGFGVGDRSVLGSSGELRYLLALAALVLLAAVIFAIWGFGAASPLIFLLALALLAGWFVL